ncbi:hypothetical protein ACFCX0_03825 [Streptomyces sp. NPDC056352]|uniref:hypothetical protein n=1 Tax=Streptomyces sp. NPDC056352 TaxID=3345791 RepID=UPI0035DF0B50
MNCDEPLYADGDDYSYRDCQLKLGHTGAHEYFGERFPRPEPADGLDPEISDLIEQAAGSRSWDLDERQYPIVVTVTSVYVIKAPGTTEDEALKYWDNGDYPDLDGEHAIDGSFEIRRVDKYERTGLTGAPIGPQIACPDCGKQAMRREWYHSPFRKCHGPIEWRENTNARSLQWRYSREHKATPVHALALATTGGAS